MDSYLKVLHTVRPFAGGLSWTFRLPRFGTNPGGRIHVDTGDTSVLAREENR